MTAEELLNSVYIFMKKNIEQASKIKHKDQCPQCQSFFLRKGITMLEGYMYYSFKEIIHEEESRRLHSLLSFKHKIEVSTKFLSTVSLPIMSHSPTKLLKKPSSIDGINTIADYAYVIDEKKYKNSFEEISFCPNEQVNKEIIKYYGLTPQSESLILRDIIDEERFNKKEDYTDPQKQGLIYEQCVSDVIQSMGSSKLVIHPRAFFYHNEKLRQLMSEGNILIQARRNVIHHMNNIEFDGVYFVKEELSYPKTHGFDVTFSNRLRRPDGPIMIFKENEVILVEIKRSYNQYQIVKFIDKVIGFHDYFQTKGSVLHLLFIYDFEEHKDHDFMTDLMNGKLSELFLKNLKHNESNAKEFKTKEKFIKTSLEIFKELTENGKVIFDCIYYDYSIISIINEKIPVVKLITILKK